MSSSPLGQGVSAPARQDVIEADVPLRETVEDRFDIWRLITLFRRRLWLFTAAVMTVFIAVLLYTLQMTPTYSANAEVMLDSRQMQVIPTKEEVLSPLSDTTAAVDTEVQVLHSRGLAEKVVQALKLDSDPEFNATLRTPGALDAVKAAISDAIRRLKPPQVAATAADRALEQKTVHDEVVDAVMSGLDVKRQGETFVIQVTYTSKEPEKAATIANKFADLYLFDQLDAKLSANQRVSAFLSQRLNEIRAQVTRDAAAVEQYKIAHNLMSASGATLTEQEISNYNQQLALNQAKLAEDQAKLSTSKSRVAAGSTGDDLGEALNSQVVQSLRSQRAAISGRLADLQGRYGPKHPDILKTQRELADIDQQIQAEINRNLANLDAEVQVSAERLASLRNSLSGAKGTLASNNRAMVGLNQLQQNATASQALYDSYIERFKQTGAQQGIEQSDARVVSHAKTPTEQSAPRVKLNLALGLLVGIGVGIGAVVLVEALRSGLGTAEEVERRLAMSYLGGIPLLSSVAKSSKKSPMRYVIDNPLSGFAEAFRSLRASIGHVGLDTPAQVVAITSALPGEGKTTTAACLAQVAALQGSRVVVVDCDMRGRGLNRILPNLGEAGLMDVLTGAATLQQAMVVDPDTGACFLPQASGHPTVQDMFSGEEMGALLSELRRGFDLVILDLPPVLPVADGRVLAGRADAVVFLARWRKTPEPAIRAAFRLLAMTGVRVAGVVLSQVDMKRQSTQGYGDPGYYYGEYKSYYSS